MSRKFVVGDIHGAHIPLRQCLERCGFDKENDLLYTIGDICDGWPYVYECVEELLTIKNRIDIVGNHDKWFEHWLKTGRHPDNWRQGGAGTKVSYLRAANLLNEWGEQRWLSPRDIPLAHQDFFNNQVLYFKDEQNRLFVHGGFYRFQRLTATENTNPDAFYWDRELWEEALSVHKLEKLTFKEQFSEIYIGHTQTTIWTKFKGGFYHLVLPGGDPKTAPMKADIIYNIDTGAGSDGRLTIMDIDTHEYWQSDLVNSIYGEYKPRG